MEYIKQCDKCIHKNVCRFTQEYASMCDKIDDIQLFSIFEVDVNCAHYRQYEYDLLK